MFFRLLLAFCFVASVITVAGEPAFARAPYLQFSTTNSIHILWRTVGPITPVVKWGKDIRQLDRELSYVSPDSGTGIVIRVGLGGDKDSIPSKWQQYRTEENLKLRKLHSAPMGTFQYEARLMGLSSDTKYYYAVFDGDKRLTPADDTYSFTTPPPIGTRRPFRFWTLGDGGTGRQEQADVYRAVLDAMAREKRPMDFWVHLGDMAYGTGKDMEFQSRFFESYEVGLRSFVCWPTMGNHEGYTSKGQQQLGPYYDAFVTPRRAEAGGLASGTEAYYSFQWGNIHFICLNSHDMDRKPDKPMAKWLKADLEKAKADWIIAFWHHPPYTKGSHDSDKEKDMAEMRQHIMPICESGGVDLVLGGHSHIYERSMLIDGVYGATNMIAENNVLDDGDGDPKSDGAYLKSEGIHPHQGTVAVVTGNAGAPLSRKGTVSIMKRTMLEFGSVIVDVDRDTLVARMVNRSGNTRDLFSIVKRGKVEPIRIAQPWQPEEWKKPTNEVRRVDPFTVAPIDYKTVIPKNAEWRFLANEHPKDRDWNRADFDASQWQTGHAGFGEHTADSQTEVVRDRNKPACIYLRREFTIEQSDRITEMGLLVDYRDGFIAYINGREVARRNIGRSSGRNAQKLRTREETGFAYVPLKDLKASLKNGANVLAIEAHGSAENAELQIHPYLILED